MDLWSLKICNSGSVFWWTSAATCPLSIFSYILLLKSQSRDSCSQPLSLALGQRTPSPKSSPFLQMVPPSTKLLKTKKTGALVDYSCSIASYLNPL
jgi:hypothetical protein